MIVPKTTRKSSIEQSADSRGLQKEELNIFALLSTQDSGDMQEECQVFSNGPNEKFNGRIKALKNGLKKQRMEQGLKLVNISTEGLRKEQEPITTLQPQSNAHNKQTPYAFNL